jgi:hypothetical protein
MVDWRFQPWNDIAPFLCRPQICRKTRSLAQNVKRRYLSVILSKSSEEKDSRAIATAIACFVKKQTQREAAKEFHCENHTPNPWRTKPTMTHHKPVTLYRSHRLSNLINSWFDLSLVQVTRMPSVRSRVVIYSEKEGWRRPDSRINPKCQNFPACHSPTLNRRSLALSTPSYERAGSIVW